MAKPKYREILKQELSHKGIIPFIGVYDVFSASIVANYYNYLFLIGFGFAASFYGLPDIGFIAWSNMVSYVQPLRAVLPNHLFVVDMNDGYGDSDIAAHVTMRLESAGASGVVLEDQKRPRRCGHLDGKELLPIDQYLDKLNRVLEARREIFVVARTDATDYGDIQRRAEAYASVGPDAVLVDSLGDFSLIRELKEHITCPIVYYQITGGKTSLLKLADLKKEGVSMVIYSAPCLFPAQAAIEKAMRSLKKINRGLIKVA